VLLISDEISEAVNNSSRILVMQSGKIVREIATDGARADEVQRLVEAGK
jgi:ABC-type sugar transport system ATPase subunit